MSEIAAPSSDGNSRIDTWVGICVVLLATFLGLCSVKAGNISQKMQKAQVDRNDNWAWFQARNIRSAVYEAAADEMSVPYPNETAELKQAREAKAESYRKKSKDQETKSEVQKKDAEAADAEYERLGAKDDQFDLCEASLAIGLAMMGVTALLKRGWLFVLALVPSTFGVAMGVAGFAGMDTNSPAIKAIIDVLS